jgi:hypothetical protein
VSQTRWPVTSAPISISCATATCATRARTLPACLASLRRGGRPAWPAARGEEDHAGHLGVEGGARSAGDAHCGRRPRGRATLPGQRDRRCTPARRCCMNLMTSPSPPRGLRTPSRRCGLGRNASRRRCGGERRTRRPVVTSTPRRSPRPSSPVRST